MREAGRVNVQAWLRPWSKIIGNIRVETSSRWVHSMKLSHSFRMIFNVLFIESYVNCCKTLENLKMNGNMGTKWVSWEVSLLNTTWKCVRIKSFSGPYFPAFGLNMERYGLSLGTQWFNFNLNELKTNLLVRNERIKDFINFP